MGDARAREVEEPAFKRATARVGFELAHFLGDRDYDFLDDFLRLGMTEPGLAGGVVDQLPVSIEKLPPALLVLPIFEPAQETPTCRQRGVGVMVHALLTRELTRRPNQNLCGNE